jgi:hypothetical protein
MVLGVIMAMGFSPAYSLETGFSGTIEKKGALPEVITFSADDFEELYQVNEEAVLDAIVITGEDPAFGALKLDGGSALDERIEKADLEKGHLTFVPDDTGVVSYIVTAYIVGEAEPVNAAALTITVEESTDAGNAIYTIDENMPVRLSSTYFSDLFHEANGRELVYVKFDLPSADRGVLYLNYTSALLYEHEVQSNTKYYTNNYPNISRITFVPGEDFSGTVSIPYTGYNADDTAYWGMLTIHVRDIGVEDIVYTVDAGSPVSFRAAHFNNVCQGATGDALSYVTFTLPAPAHGKLYYNYRSSTDYDALVSASAKYYSGEEPHLSDVDFLPAVDLVGIVRILYKGYSVEGAHYDGVITVHVEEADVVDPEEEGSDDSEHFNDVGKNISWAVEAIDYLYEEGILLGDGAGYYNPHASISRGDFIMMLSRAFDLDMDFEDNFSDVEEDDYYYKAVGAAKKFGIAKGSKGRFNPRSALSRQDAMVLIVRALEIADIDLEKGDINDLIPFKDKNNISDYARDAFETLVQAGIIEGSGKYLNPNSSVSRAEMAVILYRILTL